MSGSWKRRLLHLARDCRGYIDPGTGSYILQMLLAGVLGAGFAMKSYWAKIKAVLGGGKRKAESDS